MSSQLEVSPLKVLPPEETEETPPYQPVPSEPHAVGINIIHAIYNLFSIREPIAFGILQKYKKKLNLKLEAPLWYYVFLAICLTLDLLHAGAVIFIIIVVLVIIILSFARGIGLFDWLPEIIKSFQS